MNKNEKAEIISEVKEMIENASAVYLTDFSKINVADISNIRNEFRKEGVTYKVIKNTLFERAMNEAGKFDKVTDHLVGMTGFAFASANPVAPAKIIKTYFDKNKKLSLKAAYIEGQYYDGKQFDLWQLFLLRVRLCPVFWQYKCPGFWYVGVLNAVIRDLVSVIDEISKKQAA